MIYMKPAEIVGYRKPYWIVRHGSGITDVEHLPPQSITTGLLSKRVDPKIGMKGVLRYDKHPYYGLYRFIVD